MWFSTWFQRFLPRFYVVTRLRRYVNNIRVSCFLPEQNNYVICGCLLSSSSYDQASRYIILNDWSFFMRNHTIIIWKTKVETDVAVVLMDLGVVHTVIDRCTSSRANYFWSRLKRAKYRIADRGMFGLIRLRPWQFFREFADDNVRRFRCGNMVLSKKRSRGYDDIIKRSEPLKLRRLVSFLTSINLLSRWCGRT